MATRKACKRSNSLVCFVPHCVKVAMLLLIQSATAIWIWQIQFRRWFSPLPLLYARISTTIYNALFVSAVFDLFSPVWTVRQARFFGYLGYQPTLAKFYAIVMFNVFNLACAPRNQEYYDHCAHLSHSSHPDAYGTRGCSVGTLAIGVILPAIAQISTNSATGLVSSGNLIN